MPRSSERWASDGTKDKCIIKRKENLHPGRSCERREATARPPVQSLGQITSMSCQSAKELILPSPEVEASCLPRYFYLPDTTKELPSLWRKLGKYMYAPAQRLAAFCRSSGVLPLLLFPREGLPKISQRARVPIKKEKRKKKEGKLVYKCQCLPLELSAIANLKLLTAIVFIFPFPIIALSSVRLFIFSHGILYL